MSKYDIVSEVKIVVVINSFIIDLIILLNSTHVTTFCKNLLYLNSSDIM